MALVTEYGFQKLKEELIALEKEEKAAVDAVVVARGFGDFSENAELETATSWLERTRKKILECNQKIGEAEIFSAAVVDKTRVNFGAQVEVEDQDTEKCVVYKIVGEVEANVQEGKISAQSPLAKALHGKSVGAECVFNAPSGEKVYVIKKIDYSWLQG